MTPREKVAGTLSRLAYKTDSLEEVFLRRERVRNFV